MARGYRGGSPLLTLRTGALAPLVDERVGTPEGATRAAVVKRDLQRYYQLLAEGTAELAGQTGLAHPSDPELTQAWLVALEAKGVPAHGRAALLDAWERQEFAIHQRE